MSRVEKPVNRDDFDNLPLPDEIREMILWRFIKFLIAIGVMSQLAAAMCYTYGGLVATFGSGFAGVTVAFFSIAYEEWLKMKKKTKRKNKRNP